MAELEDALGSEPSGRNPIEVQILLPASSRDFHEESKQLRILFSIL